MSQRRRRNTFRKYKFKFLLRNKNIARVFVHILMRVALTFFVEKIIAYPLLLGYMTFRLLRKFLSRGSTHPHRCRNLCPLGHKIRLVVLDSSNEAHLGNNTPDYYRTSIYKRLHLVLHISL